jgi:excinuclease ABC subunit C
VFALAEDDLEAAVQVFHVRDGRVRGQRGWVVEKVEDVTTADLVEDLLVQVYGDVSAQGVPREVLVPAEPVQLTELELWLTGMRGSRVGIRVPQRGDKRALMSTVERNAAAALTLHKTRRAGDLTTRSVALQEIQDALGLAEAPLRIECYDVSNIAGQHVVASMVVFEDGLARKGEYRRFTIRGEDGSDDVAAIHEVITRRFRRYLDDRAGNPDAGPDSDPDRPAEEGRPKRFAYPPNLVVVDGGQPQVAAAARALTELGVDDVALCGLAKRLEEVWLPDQDLPVVLPRSSQGLFLLQRVRDEAHRFAIAHHRQRRSKAMTASELDAVPGLGPARKRALLGAFGSVQRLRDADVAQIASVPGIGPGVAASVVAALGAGAPGAGSRGQAFDAATGEILD